MTRLVLVVLSLLFIAAPALAQQGGLPALQAQVDALQAQNAALQQQISNLRTATSSLQTQINNITSAIADDGTAQVLVGTWTGSVSAVELDKAVKFTSPTTLPSSVQFFNVFGGVAPSVTTNFAVPILGPCPSSSGICQTGSMFVGVNPDVWLARGDTNPITFTFDRDGANLSGKVFQGSVEFATISGVVVSNNFFLLRIRAPATGPCAPTGFVVFQGTGSLSSDRTRMLVTGSAVEAECQHSIFRVALTKS